jgi:hypothetical protein
VPVVQNAPPGYNGTMLSELPFVSADEIAAEYRPGSSVTKKSALRTLGEKGVISAGIDSRIRGAQGSFGGSLHLYSAINLDAVRLHRRGDDNAAVKAARRAAKIERLMSEADVVPSIAEHWKASSDNLREAVTLALNGPAQAAMRQVIEATTLQREALRKAVDLPLAHFAVIQSVHDATAVLRLASGGALVQLATGDLAPTIAAREGAAIAMRWERLAPGMTLLTTSPAIDLGGETGPYDPPLPADAARIDITGALAGGPTIRRPQRIKISG